MRYLLIAFVLPVAVVLVAAGPAAADELPPGGTFVDDDGSVHEAAIEALAAADITRGCDDRGLLFCPDRSVSRGEMATFLVRALGLADTDVDFFVDDSDSQFESAINAVAAAGITLGCNPPDNDRFCPTGHVTRGAMASFLVRALDLPPPVGEAGFDDVEDSVHRDDIEALAASDVTRGCNPPENTAYCPFDRVTRAQMATFLARALPHLEPNQPPERIMQRISRFSTYHDCCEPRVTNIRLMAEALDGYIVKPGEVFSINEIVGARTTAKGYVGAPYLDGGRLACCVIGGGTSQFGTTMYNAAFWGGFEIVEHKPHSRYIDRYPLGIEATMGYPSLDVKFRNDTDTIVMVRTNPQPTYIMVELWGYAGGWQMTGYHPKGNLRSAITVTNDEGRRVSASVSGSATFSGGGSARVVRTIREPDGSQRSQAWNWTYLSSADIQGFVGVAGLTDLVEE